MTAQRASIAILAADEQRRRGLEAALAGAELDLVPQAWSARAEAVLLALESGADAASQALATARQLLDQGRARAVILSGPAPDPAVLLAAMRAGIGEYLAEPLDPAEVLAALERLRVRGRQPEHAVTQSGGRLVLVLGAKGGVGATTVAVNLAHGLCGLGLGATALLDLASPQGETPIFLDLEHAYTWGDVVANLSRLDATYLESVMARHSSGLAVLPAPEFGADTALEPAALGQLLAVLRQVYAQVVVDAGTGQDEAVVEALEQADDILLVLDLSLPCLARAKRFLEAVRASRPHLASRVRLIANRKTSQSDIGTNEAESILRQKLSWSLLNDYQSALAAINQGKPLAESDPKSALARAYAAMARDLGRVAVAGGAEEPKGKAGALWARLKSVAPNLALNKHSA